MTLTPPEASVIEVDVRRALAEDIGDGDLTARLLPPEQRCEAEIITRNDMVLCGRDWADACFRALDPSVTIEWLHADGARLSADTRLCRIEGAARGIVSAERSALNFLQTLSGTATTTRRYADALAHSKTRVLDTRKTLPGLRMAQKYAVRCGGGMNHRVGLFDAILIKENHIAAAGSIAAVIANARKIAGKYMVEVEVESLHEFDSALAAGPDRIMLDELSDADVREAVRRNGGRVELEVSGGVSFERLDEIAALGVDFVSVGALTKHLRAIDLSLRVLRRW
ncbi:MAG: carboxylating nicotinate-nucleotide diphosphorylase [Rhodanobacteraceae bacterium]|nr:carboxylating nicotinate-nucleotide diphosphorylase [Rhodanobacteraceae bacterium]MBP9154980.1 carboxylating nicotinate-nucleotide diphosphorylase [Xanthomonadales bacterium]HQW82354.1 carboxylating nicotinate-nucleotide diphosphorylase [Pseudomonadota bacterium]